MIDRGKKSVLGVLVDTVDYEAACQKIIRAAGHGRSFTVSALASHAIMSGHLDPFLRYRLNSLNLALPDGQPVRHALRLLHNEPLPDRVYGPELMLRLCALAADRKLPVYLYGSTPRVIAALRRTLAQRHPGVEIAGCEPSAFRVLTDGEKLQLAGRIRDSGARMVFVGLGCPRQEAWVFEHSQRLAMPLIAVGAAFDFISGCTPQAPAWMQRNSLEWLHRLAHDPARLWNRYLVLGPAYVILVLAQYLGLRRFDSSGRAPEKELGYG